MDFVSKVISNFGYVIPIYWEGSIVKDLAKGNDTIYVLEKENTKLKLKLSPVKNLQPGDLILVATDRTCTLHMIVDFKGETVQTANSKGKGNGFVPLKYIRGKVVSVQ